MKTAQLAKVIRDVPDFPKKGIVFKDITTLLQNPAAFRQAVNALYQRYKDKKIDAVVCIEARGFVFGAVLAYKLNAGLVLIRKKGKLPSKTYRVTYALEYGNDTLEIHQDAMQIGERVVVVDDVLATGGTISAVCRLLKKFQANIIGIGFLIELEFLKGRRKLKGFPVHALITY